jgi:acetyl esterase/lipase
MTATIHTFLCVALCMLCGAMTAHATPPMTLRDYMALQGPEPSARFVYGPAPSQYSELFSPPGNGPFPVVFLVHGGCWQKEYAGIVQMRNIAGALKTQGIAVWNVEYRRVDEEGGGFPGTFQDVAASLNSLLKEASAHQLDTTRLVAVGHSAGGHLVQWLAGRPRLPPASPLYEPQPFAIRQVIALGSLGDLRRRVDSKGNICGIDVLQLTGKPSDKRADVYLDTSPAELVPNGSHTVLINGALDSLSPPRTAVDYADWARRAGDTVELLVLPGASHFDEAAASSPAWKLILPVIQKALIIN